MEDLVEKWKESIQKAFDIHPTRADESLLTSVETTLPILAGILSFGSTLAISTSLQHLPMIGISTGSPAPIPSLIGLISVGVASYLSHQTAIQMKRSLLVLSAQRRDDNNIMSASAGMIRNTLLLPISEIATKVSDSVTTQWSGLRGSGYGERHAMDPRQWWSLFSNPHTNNMDIVVTKMPWHTLRICTVGLLAFKILGGRFWSIAPSSFTHLGSFARPRFSIPATENYATILQRQQIELLGRRFGCHTCGNRMIRILPASSGSKITARFVGDHMPPKVVAEQLNNRWFRKLLERKVSFRFYPQCIDCSSKQGGMLARATQQLKNRSTESMLLPLKRLPNLHHVGGGMNAYNHGLRPRLHHLAGGIIGAVATVGVSSFDLFDGNQRRYARISRRVNRWINKNLFRE